MSKKWYRRRKRLLEILEVGNDLDHVSRAYDFSSAFVIVLNLTVSIMYTFDNLQTQYGSVLIWIERITVAFFALDYILRLFTARILYENEKDMTEGRALKKYFFSFMGIYPVTTLGKVFGIFITFLGVGMVAIPTGIISAGFRGPVLRIRDLDISRQSIIVLVKRRNKSLIPNGNMKLEAGDRIFIYTKLHLSEANNIEI